MAQTKSSATFLLGGEETNYLSNDFGQQLQGEVSTPVVAIANAEVVGQDNGVIQRVGDGSLFGEPCRIGALIQRPSGSNRELVVLFAKPKRDDWVFQDLFPQMPPSLDAIRGPASKPLKKTAAAKPKRLATSKASKLATSPSFFLSQSGCDDSLWVFVFNPGAIAVPDTRALLSAVGADKSDWATKLSVATGVQTAPRTGLYFLGGLNGSLGWLADVLDFFEDLEGSDGLDVVCELSSVNSLPTISAWCGLNSQPHSVGPCTLKDLRLRLSSPTTFGLSGSAIAVLASCSIGEPGKNGKRPELDVELDWPLNDDRVVGRGVYRQPGLPFGAAGSLPFASKKKAGGKAKTELDVELVFSKSAKQLLLASFTAEFDKWKPFKNFSFELNSLVAAVSVMDPAGAKSVSAQLSADATLGSKGTQLKCSGTLPGGLIQFSLASNGGLSLKVLYRDLFGSLPKWMPTLKLQDLRGSYDPARKDITLDVDLAGAWKISSKPLLQLTDLRLRIDGVKSPAFALSASFVMAGTKVSINGAIANGQFAFALGTGAGGLTLAQLLEFLDPGLVSQLPDGLEDLTSIALYGMSFVYDPAKKKLASFKLSAGSDKAWTIPGLQQFAVDRLRMDFEGRAGANGKLVLGGSLGGEIEFGAEASDRLEVSAAKPLNTRGRAKAGTDPGGWQLKGSVKEPVSLGAIATRMASVAGRTLQGKTSQTATLETLNVSIETATRRFNVSGALSAPVGMDVGAKNQQFDFVFDASYQGADAAQVSSRTAIKTPASGAIFDIKLTSDLTLGGSKFDVEIDLNNTALILKGSWSGGGKSLSIAGLAKSLGIAYAVPTPKGMSLGLKKASFTFDSGQKSLSLSALTQSGLALVEVSRDLQGTWGVTAGVMVKDLSKLPGAVGTALNDLGLGNDTGMLVLSSVDRPGFQMDGFSPPEGSPLSVKEGVAFCFIADLKSGKKSAAEMDRLSKLTGADQLLIQARLSSLKDIEFSADLSGSVKLVGKGKNALTLAQPSVNLTASPFTLELGGEIDIPMDSDSDDPLDVRAFLAISPEALQADFNIDFANGTMSNPHGMSGVGIDTLGGTIGVEFEPPSLELGLEGTFHLVGQHPGGDEIAFVLGLEGDVPNPILILCKIAKITVAEIVASCTSLKPTQVPGMLNDIAASDVMIYWADSTVILPDGTTARPGFAFNAAIKILDFEAHAALSINASSGISGDAEMSPIKIGPGDGGIVRITGKGKGVPLADQRDKANKLVKKGSIVPAGGPFVRFSTKKSPYFQTSWDVELFDLLKQTVDVTVTNQGFDCQLTCSIGTAAHFDLDVLLNKSGGFKSSAAFDFALNASIGPFHVLDIPIPKIHLDVSLSLNMELDIGDSFHLALWGTFEFEGWHLTIPRLEIKVALNSLADLTDKLIAHIEDNAEEIFQDIFNEAKKAWNAVKDEAKKIGDAAEKEAQKIEKSAAKEAQKIEKSAQRLGKQIVSLAHDAEAAVKGADQETAKIVLAAAAEVEAIGVAAEEAAAQIEASGKELLQAADAFAGQVAEDAEIVVQDLQADLTQINQSIDAIENSINEDCEHAAQAISKAADKEIKALNADAQSVLHGLEASLEKIGKEIEKVGAALKKLAKAAEREAEHAWHALTGWL